VGKIAARVDNRDVHRLPDLSTRVSAGAMMDLACFDVRVFIQSMRPLDIFLNATVYLRVSPRSKLQTDDLIGHVAAQCFVQIGEAADSYSVHDVPDPAFARFRAAWAVRIAPTRFTVREAALEGT
jgi:hypothetical protein